MFDTNNGQRAAVEMRVAWFIATPNHGIRRGFLVVIARGGTLVIAYFALLSLEPGEYAPCIEVGICL